MREANRGWIAVIVLTCLFAGASPSAARNSPGEGNFARGHAARNAECQSGRGDLARRSAQLSGAFETEYDVENWEKALRQELVPRNDRRGVCNEPAPVFPRRKAR
jgi:hypothetical protein